MTDSLPAHEHLETAEQIAHSLAEGGVKSAIIPLSIAVMAVIAAAFGSLETTAVSSQIAAATPGANTDQLNAHAKKFESQEADLQSRAKAKEDEVARQVAISEAALEHHHRLAYATNIVHLAIAIASISILVRRRWLWFGSLACLAASIVIGLT